VTERLYPSFGILLVDDEVAWLRSLALTLERVAGIRHVVPCEDPRRVMQILHGDDIGVVLLDLTMPHLSGEEVLQQIAAEHPEVAVIVVSGLNQLETAVRCVRLGAFDYHVKTEEEDRLVAAVLRAVRMQELRRENEEITGRFLSGEIAHPEAFAGIVTRDATMRTLFSYVEAVATSPQPLLVTGESGVGKELVATAAHRLSGCPGKLVAVNVAGQPERRCSPTPCSATCAVRSPGRISRGAGWSRRRRTGPCSWTRSAISPSRRR